MARPTPGAGPAEMTRARAVPRVWPVARAQAAARAPAATRAPDCDDQDPSRFPGNPEICGDGIDNDCNLEPDDPALCQGLGTFVSVMGNDMTGRGTMTLPFATIAKAVDVAVNTIKHGVDVYVAEGTYTEKVVLHEGTDILGGFDCSTASCTWTRDPAAHQTTIRNIDWQGVLVQAGVTRATRLDGLQIQGMSGVPTAKPGTVALSIEGGAPTITNNRIVAGDVSGGASGEVKNAVAIRIVAPNADPLGPMIRDNEIAGGASPEGSTGILFDTNQPTVPPPTVNATIASNRIRGGSGRVAQGIAAWTSGQGTIVQFNDIQGGDPTTALSQSWAIAVGGQMTIDANRVNTIWDPTHAPRCGHATEFCGGLVSYSATAKITNNVILGAVATNSAGVLLAEAEKPAGEVILNSNYLGGGGIPNDPGVTNARSAAVALRKLACGTGCGVNAVVGNIRNNYLEGGLASPRYGVFEESPVQSGQTIHPRFLDHNRFWFLTPGGTSIYYRYYSGTGGGQNYDEPSDLAALPLTGASDNVAIDCKFDQTWHLTAGSACINAGTPTEAPSTDMDSDPRPASGLFDIGPDERQ